MVERKRALEAAIARSAAANETTRGETAMQLSLPYRGASAPGPSNSGSSDRQQQDVGGIHDDVKARRIRQRSENQPQLSVEEPEPEPPMPRRKKSVSVRLEDEQYNAKVEADRRKQQRKRLVEEQTSEPRRGIRKASLVARSEDEQYRETAKKGAETGFA